MALVVKQSLPDLVVDRPGTKNEPLVPVAIVSGASDDDFSDLKLSDLYTKSWNLRRR